MMTQGDGPNLKDFLAIFTAEEMKHILSTVGRSSLHHGDRIIAEMVLAIRAADYELAKTRIHTVAHGGYHLPHSLAWALDEAVRAGSIPTAKFALQQIKRWSGRIKGDLHAIARLEEMLSSRSLTTKQQEIVGSMGAAIVRDYLELSAPGLSSTTNLATFQAASGRVEEATREYEQIRKRSPGMGALHNNLAYHLATTGIDINRGLKLVQEAILLEPAGAAYYLDTRGWLHFQNNNAPSAYNDIVASLRLGPLISSYASAESLTHAAQVAWRLGKRDLARRHALRARLLTPRKDKLSPEIDLILKDVFPDQPATDAPK